MDINNLWDKVRGIFEPLRREVQDRIKDVSSCDGSASRWPSTEAYCKACLINENTGSPADLTQDKCSLPVKDTDGQYVRQAIHAAAGGHGVTQVNASPEAKKNAANELISLYNQMDEVAPDSVYQVAGKTPPE